MRSRKSVQAAVACTAVLVLALLAATASRGEPPAITAKRMEARAVLREIHKLDARLELAVEAYNAATVKLLAIRTQLKLNRHELAVAEANLKLAEQRLAARLRHLYMSPGGDATIELLLGATSLEDLLDRLDTAKRVASMDSLVLNEVRRYRRAVIRQGVLLRRAREAQLRLVGERAAAKARIQHGLASRRRLLASIRSEIERLQAEEAARQARLAAAARANLFAWKLAQQQRLNETVVGVTAEGAGAGGSSVGVAPPSPYAGVVGVALGQL